MEIIERELFSDIVWYHRCLKTDLAANISYKLHWLFSLAERFSVIFLMSQYISDYKNTSCSSIESLAFSFACARLFMAFARIVINLVLPVNGAPQITTFLFILRAVYKSTIFIKSNSLLVMVSFKVNY